MRFKSQNFHIVYNIFQRINKKCLIAIPIKNHSFAYNFATYENMDTIISTLKSHAWPYRQIRTFSYKPGIYAIYFIGEKFPLEGCSPAKDEIIYLGKTESSQAHRDEHTHFASGKTGSSTLRRSIGALLRDELSLVPVLRNDIDFDAGRKSFFKFDELSEEKLTKWMKDNLALSFYECDETPAEIDATESQLIAETKPVLNIDSKNPDNPFAKTIKAARKACADEANNVGVKTKASPEPNASPEPVQTKVVPYNPSPAGLKPTVHKYEEVFKNALPRIEKAIDESGSRKLSIQLQQADFKKAGDRQSYSFNLEFSDGVVSNDIGGVAVARDLARVMEQDPGILKKLKGRHMKFNMDKGFTLWVSNK